MTKVSREEFARNYQRKVNAYLQRPTLIHADMSTENVYYRQAGDRVVIDFDVRKRQVPIFCDCGFILMTDLKDWQKKRFAARCPVCLAVHAALPEWERIGEEAIL